MESKKPEKQAKQEQSDKPERPEPQNPNKITTKNIEFTGKVIEVNSGDSITIQSTKKEGKTGKFTFTNVRAPQANRNTSKPYSFEAKEFIRKLLIGKEVKVLYEYDKTFMRKNRQYDDREDDMKEVEEEVTMAFASVFLEDKNVGALLLEKGYADLNRPRYTNEMSKNLEDLEVAFAAAKKLKLAIHREGAPYNPPRYNDISRSKNIQKSREALQFLKEQKRLTGVVELVLSGSRLKVRVNEQNCMIILLLQGVRCLPNDANLSGYEEWSNKALKFSKDTLMQRDIELIIDSIDKKGCFHGTIFIQKEKIDFSTLLLQQGLAVVFDKCRFTADYEKFEEEAKQKKVGIWGAAQLNLESIKGENFSELRVVKQINQSRQDLVLSEIISLNEFYMQAIDNPVLKKVSDDLEQLDPDKYPVLVPPIKKGTPCLAVFSQDGLFYRAVVEKSNTSSNQQHGKRQSNKGKCLVQFVDFGNYEEVDIDDMRKLPAMFQGIEPQAIRCSLAYVDETRDRDLLEEACLEFKQLAWNQKLLTNIEYQERGINYVILNFAEKPKEDKSVNHYFLKKGYVRLSQDIQIPEKLESWKAEEDVAKDKKVGLWSREDDEDDE